MIPYDLYRYYHGNGSSKDWAIRDNKDGTITRRYGKTGSRLAEKISPCPNPFREMHELVQKKYGKGYRYLGEHFIDEDGKLTKDKPQPDHNKPFVLQSFIYWRVRYPSSLHNDAENPIYGNYIKAISQLLGVFSNIEPTSTAWIRAFLARQASILEAETIAGQLSKSDGVIPLLFLMALKKLQSEAFLKILISADNGIEISDNLKEEPQALAFFDESLDTVRTIAEATGLLLKSLSLHGIQPEIAGSYF